MLKETINLATLNRLKYIPIEKSYELSNHLGNVLTVVTDKKVGVESTTISGDLAYYQSDVISYSDYYPFGMLQPNINGGESYRYGMNGMEQDDEVSGKGNSYTATFWQYDSRLGRQWNTDPVVKTHESPYATFANNPIWFVDPSDADSTLYLYMNTKHEYYDASTKDGKLHIEELANEIQRIYSDNNTGIIREVKILYSAEEVNEIVKKIHFTDGIVEYNDDYYGPGVGAGATVSFFYSFVGVPKTKHIGDYAYNMAYNGAHEYLHQLVNKAGAFGFGNVSHFGFDGHVDDGGLLSNGNHEALFLSGNHMNISKKGGTGIEKINTILLSKISPLLKNASSEVVSFLRMGRYYDIMEYRYKPKITSKWKDGYMTIKDGINYYQNYDKDVWNSED